MSKRLLVLMCSVFLIVPLLFMGCGSDGSNGSNAPRTGNIAGTVTDNTALNPIQGVTVTAKDSGGAVKGTATTDAAGAYTLANLPLGTVTVYFAAENYTSPGGMMVGVLGGQTVTINAALGESAAGAPSVSITGYNNGMYTTDDFGYGGTASLAASGNAKIGTLTYTWSNATAPALGSVSGSDTSATVTFPTMAQAMAQRQDTANKATISGYDYLNGRFGVLPIINDARGAVSAKVTVTDGHGGSASVTLTLNAASVLTGSRNVPMGSRVYMNRGDDNTSKMWEITAKPAGSTAALDNASIRTPSFVADVAGAYTLTAGSDSITLYAGTWVGVIDGPGATATDYSFGAGCTVCHNDSAAVDEFTPWYDTGHAKIFTLGVTGGSGTSGISCAPCHTVGFDRGTDNGGFDDLASSTGWIFPKRTATAWTDMLANFPTVAKLANIQCENCHGPQASQGHMSTGPLGAIDNNNTFASARISYSAELCGTCHAAGAGHNLYSQWSMSGHGNRQLAIDEGTSTSCGRCHGAQGFTVYLDQLDAGVTGSLDNVTAPSGIKWATSVTAANVEPVTCTACHDPHDVSNPNQLRVFGDTAKLPSGFKMTGVGKGALCITCHNSRNGVHDDSITLASYSAPHRSAQGDVFAGRNAFFMGSALPMVSRHAAVEDACVGCHMALNPKTHLSHGSTAVNSHLFRIDDADAATVCANCHSANVNGEGIKAATEAGLALLESKIEAAVLAKINGTSSVDTGVDNVAGTAITAAKLTESHGRVSFDLTYSGKTVTVRISDLKATGGSVLYSENSNVMKGSWNFFLIEADSSFGFHNPSFVQAVLNNTAAQTF